MLLHSSFFSPTSGVWTSCVKSLPPPVRLRCLDCHRSASLGSPPTFVNTGASLENPPLALHEPFIITRASGGCTQIPHLSFLLLHSEVLTLGSPRATFVVVGGRTYFGSASFRSTQPPTDCALGIHCQDHSRLFLSHSLKC